MFSQLPEMVDFLAAMPDFDSDLYTHKKMKTNPDIAKAALEMAKPVLEGIAAENWNETTLHDTVMAAVAESGMKNGQVLWPLRIAISGKANTPGGAFEIAYLLGKAETMRRLEASLAKL